MALEDKFQPVFIVGAYKSGTSLLRSLFDGHPEVNVIPIESHFIELLGIKSNNFIRNNDKTINRSGNVSYLENLKNLLMAYNVSNSQYSDYQGKFQYDINLINEEKERNNLNEAILHIWHLINRITKNNYEAKNIMIEKSVENYEFASYLKLLFPNACFIHIVRNPYDNLVSLRKFKSNNHFPSLFELVQTIKSSFDFAKKNETLINDYYVIKYEDLCRNTEDHMRIISRNINIRFSDVLLKPTENLSPWKGNSVFKKSFNSVSVNTHKESEIKNIEIELINRGLTSYFEVWNYERLSRKRRFNYLGFNKSEKLSTYIRNRVALLFT